MEGPVRAKNKRIRMILRMILRIQNLLAMVDLGKVTGLPTLRSGIRKRTGLTGEEVDGKCSDAEDWERPKGTNTITITEKMRIETCLLRNLSPYLKQKNVNYYS